MIARLKGSITDKSPDHVILDVGGVGYQVFLSATSLSGLPAENSEVSLHIYTHVREDQLILFGFSERTEKDIFLRLLGVSGIGPKVAMTILSGMKPHDLVQAVIGEDLSRLTSVQGIGRKTAERIVVDLKDKFIKEFGGLGAQTTVGKPLYNDAVSALINLGYARSSIERAFCKMNIPPGSTVQVIVKQALRQLKM